MKKAKRFGGGFDIAGTVKKAVLLHQAKHFDEAEKIYRQVLKAQPNNFDCLHLLGVIHYQRGNHAAAVSQIDAALRVQPNVSDAFNNRGNALRGLNRLDEALASFDRAIALDPGFAESFFNRGVALQELNRLDEALVSYDRAIVLNALYAKALNNRGNVLKEMKRLDEALGSFDRAIALQPGYADAYYNRETAFYNRGMVRLLAGRYKDGWPDYEWRWKARGFSGRPPKIDASPWLGQNLAGRRIIVHCEQGMGDVIQFARYLPLLVRRGATVTFFSPANLVRLLRPLSAEIEIIGTMNGSEAFDFQCALMSLPHRFGTELASIPAPVPYLAAEDDLIARWKARIGEHGFKIGITWQGNPEGKIDRGRSIPLAEYIPLSRLPGVRLISLQKTHGLEQIPTLPPGTGVEVLGDDFDAGPDAFVDTAAVMANLDLIVTSDTSIAHLAGALSLPTWVAIKHVPDWRWLLEREDSPWYPTMRLFRQQTDGDWKSVFAKIGQEVCALMGKAEWRTHPGTVPNPASAL